MKHPGRWLWLILIVPVAIGLLRLRFDVEVFDLLPSDLPVVKGLKLYQQYFANARELIITLHASQPEEAEVAARTLAEQLRARTNLIAGVTWEPPWLEHPGQVGELLAYIWFNQPPEIFQQLTNRLAPEKLSSIIAATREQLSTTLSPDEMGRLGYDPFGLTRLPEESAGAAPTMTQGQEAFSSADGKFRIIYVKAAYDLPTFRECDRWLKAVKTIPSPAHVVLSYTGRPVFVAEVASGMQHDVHFSVGGTAIIIALLFWLAHRRVKPMLWLLTLLALILGSTLALGGLIFGSINVVSMGFAAILLGLAVDYAVVHYQEALAHPNLTIPEIRSAIAPSIFWAAVTTISAFLVLNFGGLPGLGQLGTLVGLGVAVSACIMIFEFLPPLFPERRMLKKSLERVEKHVGEIGKSGETAAKGPRRQATKPEQHFSVVSVSRKTRFVFGVTIITLALATVVLLRGLPRIDSTANALRPRNSTAYATLDEIKRNMNQGREPFWVIAGGQNESEVATRLDMAQLTLDHAITNHIVDGYTLATPLWPRAANQSANRAAANQLVAERTGLKQAALTNGFTENAIGLTQQMLDTWEHAAHSSGIFWPSNELVQWIFEKATARTSTNCFALGLLNPNPDLGKNENGITMLQSELAREGIWLSGWELLGNAIFSRVKANMWFVLLPMVCLVFLSLLFAFRRPPEVLLSLAVLLLSGVFLLAVMRLAGWSWNLLNLMALPLVLGTGVDYSIFMQLALRRHHGDLKMAYQSVGRALLLCGGTATAGFGSLAFSTNAGMGSLGQVCAVGIASNMLISIFLLPVWWQTAVARRLQTNQSSESGKKADGVKGPSLLYRSESWRLGLWLIRAFPTAACVKLSHFLARLYWMVARDRQEIVIQNLLPGCGGDRARARKMAKKLFQQFTLKLVHLFRYEAGRPIDDLFGESSGWEHFEKARDQKRGVLLLTPHLGNWEFGAPWLAKRGVALQVITMAEPTQEFTKLRQASRARWNIETLVIGEDPFAFLEVIKRLEGGAAVALLVDRPPPATSTTVTLFEKPFTASIAAAELARASGCVLLPVYLPYSRTAYAAHVLPAIDYDRAALRDRAKRQELTQRIISVFEPIIRQHLDQWYHFVPVWRE